MVDYSKIIVPKPWGYEYLVYENEDVALWCLHINEGESTSMHCHPKKTTGLVLLNGEAEVSFLADKRIIKGLDKIMIRRGLFHQTKALSEGGIDLFEIETPNDKEDLVRLSDNYDRKNKPYETTFQERNDTHLSIVDDEFNSRGYNNYGIFSKCDISIYIIHNIEQIDKIPDDAVVIFLKGGMVRTIDNKNHLVTIPGDVGLAKIVKGVAKQLDGVDVNTTIMVIKNENLFK